MQAKRKARLESVIIEELSRVVRREVKDPRIAPFTFTRVEVAPDAKQATLHLTLLGGIQMSPSPEEYETKMKTCLEGLGKATPFLRRQLAKVLDLRYVPELIFKEDRGLENSYRVHELLKTMKSEEPKE